jgi:hypothetical protein
MTPLLSCRRLESIELFSLARNDRFGSKTEVAALRRDVCFAPVSGHRQAVSACPKRAANSGSCPPDVAKTKSRPKAALNSIMLTMDQAAINAGFDLRR